MTPSCSTAFHPESDGQTEQTNQTLEQYLRHYVGYNQDDWVQLLPLAEFAYNNTIHSATGTSPFYATYGWNPALDDLPLPHPATAEVPAATARVDTIHTTLAQVRAHLTRAQESAKRTADQHRRPTPFKVGDLVWLLTRNLASQRPSRKLDYRKIGPFPIVEEVNPVAFRLQLPPSLHIHNVFHASLLSPHTVNRIPGQVEEKPPPVRYAGQEEEEYEVGAILEVRKRWNQWEWLVEWKGYGPEDRTWQWWADLKRHAGEAVRAFYTAHPDCPRPAWLALARGQEEEDTGRTGAPARVEVEGEGGLGRWGQGTMTNSRGHIGEVLAIREP